MSQTTVLVVDDDDSLRRVLEYNLERAGYRVETAAQAEEALRRFRAGPFDVVITDILMPGIDGIRLLQKIRSVSAEAIVIVITAHGTIQTAIEAMRLGAHDYLTKPFTDEQLQIAVERALRTRRLVQENRLLRRAVEERFRFSELVGSAPAMRRLFDEVAQVAGSDSAVLISGESGTGKELIAKAIHFHSLRKDRPLVVVNCGAIPDSLLESELFGHTQGAFTGAVADKQGKLEAADGGTVFLDEVGELPLHLQGKLLRVLQDGQVDKIGAVHPLQVDLRVISATNRDLEAMVRERRFREDLFYRLNIIPIRVPPLRERSGDIPLLLDHFLRRFCRRERRPLLKLSREALTALERHRWPGNVRELENLAERLVVMTRGTTVRVDHLPEAVRGRPAGAAGWPTSLPPEGVSLAEVEESLIRRALATTGGNQTRAAKLLGISRNTLLYRMGKYRISNRSG